MTGLKFDNVEEFLKFAYKEESIKSGIVYQDDENCVYSVDPKDKSMVTNGGWLSRDEFYEEVYDNPRSYKNIRINEYLVSIRYFDRLSIIHKSTLKDIFHSHDMIIGRLNGKGNMDIKL